MNQFQTTVANAGENTRLEFIKQTYLHLAYAILGFIAIEYLLLNSPVAELITRNIVGGYRWLLVLGAFMGISWLADSWARSATSKPMQYAGLALYVFADAIIFVPMLYVAKLYSPDIILLAGIFTGLLFIGLTFTAFTAKTDFSFLGGFLKIGFFIALGAIVVSVLFGFTLGTLFSAAMILFASGSILYSTSNIIRHYRSDQYVAAALSLFASVALLFWYILRILMSFSSD